MDEIVKPETPAEQQKTFQHLDKQVEIIAGNLKLPKPEMIMEVDRHKLAVTLTTIQVANFEEVTGEQVSEKTFEVLVETNVLGITIPPQPETVQQIQEEFGDLSAKLDFSSNLEAETLNALLNPPSVEFDEQLIFQTQNRVETNEIAAREIATLIQISYGGQADSFTDDFKFDLAEQIYYVW